MSRLWCLTVISFLVALPSVGLALDMEGMGMVGILDKVEIQTKTVGKVVFSHRVHGTNCSTCHPKIFKKKSNSNHVVMKAMERGRSCGTCHNGRTAFTVKANCTTCHAGDILFKPADAGDVTFSHAVHIDMFGCGECHPDLFKAERGSTHATMEEMEQGKACGACHDGSTAFSVAEDCDSCHQS